jgi:hypothetical protein
MSGIGPAVEVEFDAGEVGPFRARAFVEAGAYRILGDRDLNLYDSVSIDDAIGMDRFEARWSMEADPWLYRVGIGVRVSIPEAR